MKEKSWLKYFFIIILIILMVFCENYIFHRITNIHSIINMYIAFIIPIVFNISIGLLLGLEYVIQEIKKIGSWRFNIAKFVILGIPSLYFSFGIFIYFTIGKYLPNVFTHPIFVLISNKMEYQSVFQMILGYSIVSSFYKKVDDIRM